MGRERERKKEKRESATNEMCSYITLIQCGFLHIEWAVGDGSTQILGQFLNF